MSIINQMLRDLDARGASLNAQPAIDHQAPPAKHRPGMGLAAALFVLVSAVGVTGVWVASNQEDREPPPAAVAMVPPETVAAAPAIAPGPAPVETAPAVSPDQVEVPSVPPKPAVEAGVRAQPLPVPVEQKPVAMPAAQGGHPSVAPLPAAPAERAVPASVPATVEPTVVKKLVEITPQMEAQQLYDEAQALRRAAKDDAAMGKYRLALERNPGMRSARMQLARLLQERGQPDAALSLLKTGYEQKPDDGLAIAAGRLLADQGRREEALNWLERGHDGLRPADHALMGALLSQTLRYEAAVRSYQRALAVNPDQGGWLLGLGLAQEAIGRIEEAHVAYRKALEHGEFKPDVVRFLRQKLGMPGL